MANKGSFKSERQPIGVKVSTELIQNDQDMARKAEVDAQIQSDGSLRNPSSFAYSHINRNVRP